MPKKTKTAKSGPPESFPFSVNNVDVQQANKRAPITASYRGHLLHRFGATTSPAQAFYAVRAWDQRVINTLGQTVTVDLASGQTWDAVTGRSVSLLPLST